MKWPTRAALGELLWPDHVRFCLRWLATRRLTVAWFLVLVVLATLAELLSLGVFFPLLQYLQYDQLQPTDEVSRRVLAVYQWLGVDVSLVSLLAGGLLVAYVAVALTFWRSVLAHQLFFLVRKEIRDAAFSRVVGQSHAHAARFDRGELIHLLGNEIDRLGHGIYSLVLIAGDVALIVGYSILLLKISTQMIWLIAGMVALKMVLSAHFMRRARQIGADYLKAAAWQNRQLLNSMKALYVLKAFSAEARDEGRFRDATLKYARQHIRAAVNTELLVLVDLLVTPTIFCLVLYAGYAWFHLEIAVLFVYLFGLKRIAPSVSAINTRRNAVHGYMAGLRRVRDILEVPDPTPVASGPRRLSALPETIVFEQVSYRYHQAAEPAVHELSLTLRRGERIALVGQSGGGKSTVLNLLLRLQDPTAGRLLADGVDVREYDLRDWHRLIGLVTQDAVLITDTVRENLCYGLERQVTQAELEEAARAAQAHDFIMTLPQGYDTVIGEDAMGMSGGQRQRLGIARAFLRQPQLLILDEPTSALDPVTEKDVHAAMDRLASNRTVVTVTHRLATIRSVDRIYVIERGQLVAVGTHDELLASSPEYRLYYETQVS